MKINNIAPIVFGILMTILIMFATSCATSKVTTSKYGMHVNKNYNICPAYN